MFACADSGKLGECQGLLFAESEMNKPELICILVINLVALIKFQQNPSCTPWLIRMIRVGPQSAIFCFYNCLLGFHHCAF